MIRRTVPQHPLVPATLPCQVVGRPAGIQSVVAAGPIQHHLKGVPQLVLPRFLPIAPWLLSSRVVAPRRTTALLTLAVAGIWLVLIDGSNLVGIVPVIRPIISLLESVIRAVIPPE